MSLYTWTVLLSSLEATLAFVTLLLLIRERQLSRYWPLLAPLSSGMVPGLLFWWLRTYRLFSPKTAYDIYFYTFWSVYTIAALASASMTYIIFNEALRPLKGLKTLGRIMFLWCGSVSVIVTVGSALLPHPNIGLGVALTVIELVRSSGILVVSLILFVGFAILPLGLSLQSRVFGIGLGIGMIALANLALAGYFAEAKKLYSKSGLTLTLVQCLAELIWIYYLSRPEPKRKFVLLPTTSPFHAWNQISEMLGYEPGYVAIGGVPPEAFAPAELDIFGRASRPMADADLSSTQGLKALLSQRRSAGEEKVPPKPSAEASERLMKAFKAEE